MLPLSMCLSGKAYKRYLCQCVSGRAYKRYLYQCVKVEWHINVTSINVFK